jgi:hypothetical protein
MGETQPELITALLCNTCSIDGFLHQQSFSLDEWDLPAIKKRQKRRFFYCFSFDC